MGNTDNNKLLPSSFKGPSSSRSFHKQTENQSSNESTPSEADADSGFYLGDCNEDVSTLNTAENSVYSDSSYSSVDHGLASSLGLQGDTLLNRLLSSAVRMPSLPLGSQANNPEIKFHLQRILECQDNNFMALEAMQELCVTLSISGEEDLMDSFQSLAIVQMIFQKLASPVDQEDPVAAELQLVTCRCLANLLEAIPFVSKLVINSGGVAILASKLLDVSYMDLTEQALITLQKLTTFSGNALTDIIGEERLPIFLQCLDFLPLSSQRIAAQIVAGATKNTPSNLHYNLVSLGPSLANILTQNTDPKVRESVGKALLQIIFCIDKDKLLLEKFADDMMVEALVRFLQHIDYKLPGFRDICISLSKIIGICPERALKLLSLNISDVILRNLHLKNFQIEAANSVLDTKSPDSQRNLDVLILLNELLTALTRSQDPVALEQCYILFDKGFPILVDLFARNTSTSTSIKLAQSIKKFIVILSKDDKPLLSDEICYKLTLSIADQLHFDVFSQRGCTVLQLAEVLIATYRDQFALQFKREGLISTLKNANLALCERMTNQDVQDTQDAKLDSLVKSIKKKIDVILHVYHSFELEDHSQVRQASEIQNQLESLASTFKRKRNIDCTAYELLNKILNIHITAHEFYDSGMIFSLNQFLKRASNKEIHHLRKNLNAQACRNLNILVQDCISRFDGFSISSVQTNGLQSMRQYRILLSPLRDSELKAGFIISVTGYTNFCIVRDQLIKSIHRRELGNSTKSEDIDLSLQSAEQKETTQKETTTSSSLQTLHIQFFFRGKEFHPDISIASFISALSTNGNFPNSQIHFEYKTRQTKPLTCKHGLYDSNRIYREFRVALNTALEQVINVAKGLYQNGFTAGTSSINDRLSFKVDTILNNPAIVLSCRVPSWIYRIVPKYKFLFSFDLRLKYVYAICLGHTRYIQRWSQTHNSLANPFLASMKPEHKKFTVSRYDILGSLSNIMDENSHSPKIFDFEFSDEIGTGLGPTLEFYTLASEEFIRHKDMWSSCCNKTYLFPKPLAPKNSFHLLGLFVGRAILDDRVIDIPLHPLMFADPSKLKPNLEFLSEIDTDLTRSLTRLKELNSDVSSLELYFTFPSYPEIELISGGCNVRVTNNTLNDYVTRVCDVAICSGVQKQIAEFRRGLLSSLPPLTLEIFSPDELCRICGHRNEDWSQESLKANIKVDHGFTHDTEVITWLLDLMGEMTLYERSRYIKFLTGASKLPLGGFSSLCPNLTIVRRPAEAPRKPDDYLPSVMTCANYLKLPEYSSKQVLKEKLELAVTEGQESFHLS